MTDSENHRFVLYHRRWLVLASFSLLSCSSAWIWITWAPIAVYLANDLWDTSLSAVDDLSGVFMYVYVPGSFISLYLVVNHLGLRRGLILGGLLNSAGAALRYAKFDDYRAVYIGTVICALAQTFTLSTPPLIAGNWFGANERATATALGILANQMGTAFGLGATTIIDVIDHSSGLLNKVALSVYLKFQFAFSAMALLALIIFSDDNPPTPPSVAALQNHDASQYDDKGRDNKKNPGTETTLLLSERSLIQDVGLSDKAENQCIDTKRCHPSYLQSIQMVFQNVVTLAFIACFGLTVGVYYTIPTFLSQILPPSWSDRAVGWVGVVYQMVGVLGSFFAGRVLDVNRNHRTMALWCLGLTLVFLVLFLIGTEASGFVHSSWATVGAIGLAGVCLSAFNTVGVELGTSITYPADEAAIAGILESAAELSGFLWVSIGGYIGDYNGSKTQTTRQIIAMLALCVLISFTILSSIRMDPRRPT